MDRDRENSHGNGAHSERMATPAQPARAVLQLVRGSAGGGPTAVAMWLAPPEELPQKPPNTTYFLMDTRRLFWQGIRNARNMAVFCGLPSEQMVMARLVEFFTPLFSYGLAIDEQIADGAAQGSVDKVYMCARTLIEQARSSALATGKPAAAVESAAFAMVAWFDEIITRNPSWWSQAIPLQVSLFNTNNAGNEFFEYLSNLKGGDEEVREVYYHALLLGFVGQYYFETGDHGELGKIKELSRRQLPVAPAPLHTLREEQITPQPYQMKDPSGPRYPRQWDTLLMKVGAVVALLIPLVYLVWFFLSPAHVIGHTVQQPVNRKSPATAASISPARSTRPVS
jgi:type IV/VI secretion system ImpK/VasF family protein